MDQPVPDEPQFSGTPDDTQSYQALPELHARFHRIIRASGGANATRLLVLPTLYTNADQPRLDAPADTITAPRDPMVAATVHFYGFWPFSANITQFDNRSVEDVTGTFDRVYNAFTSKGVPVIMGEYSLFGIDPNYPGIIERGEVRKSANGSVDARLLSDRPGWPVRRGGVGRGVRSRRGWGGCLRGSGRRGRPGPTLRSVCRGRSGRHRRIPW